jgi:hypothetical protein
MAAVKVTLCVVRMNFIQFKLLHLSVKIQFFG